MHSNFYKFYLLHIIASEASSSSDINAPVSVYIYIHYIIYIYRTFGPAGGAKCMMASTRKCNRLIEVQRSSYQTVQVSRFQRDPPDFTRSVPLPDVLPRGIFKIPRSSSPLAHYYNALHLRALVLLIFNKSARTALATVAIGALGAVL